MGVGVIVGGAVALLVVVVLWRILRPRKEQAWMQEASCPQCGWAGRTSRHAGRCPKCNAPIGERRADRQRPAR